MKDDKIKGLRLRLPEQAYRFLKKTSYELEVPMNSIILECIENCRSKYEKKCKKKKLTKK